MSDPADRASRRCNAGLIKARRRDSQRVDFRFCLDDVQSIRQPELDVMRATDVLLSRLPVETESAIRRYMDDNLVATCDGAEPAGDSRDDRQGDGSCGCLPSWIFSEPGLPSLNR